MEVSYMEVSMAMEVPKNGWLIMEIPIKMNDLGVPLFQETSIFLFAIRQQWQHPPASSNSEVSPAIPIVLSIENRCQQPDSSAGSTPCWNSLRRHRAQSGSGEFYMRRGDQNSTSWGLAPSEIMWWCQIVVTCSNNPTLIACFKMNRTSSWIVIPSLGEKTYICNDQTTKYVWPQIGQTQNWLESLKKKLHPGPTY